MKSILTSKTYPLLLVAVSIYLITTLPGCSMNQYKGDPELIGYTEYGRASFYAMKYLFRKTSSGERFNQLALTAAHRTLPFGTKVRVTNIKNNQSVTVKINDRGPFIDGRIIDLTRYAFSKIENTDSGIIEVKIEVIN